MKIIVGLGNPGNEYSKTKHNIGFQIIDKLSEFYNVKLDIINFQAKYGILKINNEKIFLVKPLTYMNNSGISVRKIMNFYKIKLSELLVIQDDMDLKIGKLKLRTHGSSGGHNGIKSIIEMLNSQEFKRIKVGIGHPINESVINWVLTPFNKSNEIIIDEVMNKATEAIKYWINTNDFNKAMNKFNS